jgi:hypothetical protein
VVGFTATPDIFLQGSIDQTVPVVVVPVLPGKNGYIGLDQLLRTRIQAFDGFRPEVSKIIPRGPGYILMRLSHKHFHRDFAIVQDIAASRKATCTVYASGDAHLDGVQPIDQLKPRLAQDPGPRQHFLIIKAALGAGDDLSMLDGEDVNLRKDILAVFEDRFAATMAAAQSVGRWTGYHEDKFPIFVAQKTINALYEQVQLMNGILYEGILPEPTGRRSTQIYVSESGLFEVGTWDEYLKNRPLQGVLPEKRSTADNRRTFRDALRGKAAAGAQSFVDFSRAPVDAHELMCYSSLKAKYSLKPGQGLWFGDLVPIVRKTKTVLNPTTKTEYFSPDGIFEVGTWDEYLKERPLQDVLKHSKVSRAHGAYARARNGTMIGEISRFLSFEVQPSDPVELSHFKYLKRKHHVKTGQGLWFKNLAPKIQDTTTVFNPLQQASYQSPDGILAVGTYEEYLEKRPLKDQLKPGLLAKAHDAYRRAAAGQIMVPGRFLSFENEPTDPEELKHFKSVKRKYKLKKGQGLYLKNLEIKYTDTRTVFNPLKDQQ